MATSIHGFRFLLLLSPCPTGWKSEPEESVELIDYAVRCGLFPLYEVFDGERYRINVRPDGTKLEEYTNRQRRYSSAEVNIGHLEAEILQQWRLLDGMANAFPAADA